MISFEARNHVLKKPDMIARKAHTIYPHLSTSRVRGIINKDYSKQTRIEKAMMKISRKLIDMRNKMADKISELPIVIKSMKEGKVGNCYEEARLAEIIGRINGEKNIYSGRIFFGSPDSKEKPLDHVVAFITSKNVEPKNMLTLKNKEGIIIDPWLGIADFAGEYFNKLKTIFKPQFERIPNKTSEIGFRIEPNFEEFVGEGSVEELKVNFPELIIKK